MTSHPTHCKRVIETADHSSNADVLLEGCPPASPLPEPPVIRASWRWMGSCFEGSRSSEGHIPSTMEGWVWSVPSGPCSAACQSLLCSSLSAVSCLSASLSQADPWCLWGMGPHLNLGDSSLSTRHKVELWLSSKTSRLIALNHISVLWLRCPEGDGGIPSMGRGFLLPWKPPAACAAQAEFREVASLHRAALLATSYWTSFPASSFPPSFLYPLPGG